MPGDWQSEFHKVYALDDGEIIRLVPSPFIPERVDFLDTLDWNGLGRKPQILSCVITWDGTNLRLFSAVEVVPRDMANALRQVGGIWPQDTDLPREKLSRRVDGDWVIRVGATTDQKIAALAPLLLGQGKTLALKPVERDVIVASGTFDYKPREAAQQPSTLYPQIRLYSGPRRSESSSACQTKEDMLNELGEVLNHPMIIEALSGKSSQRVLSAESKSTSLYPYKGKAISDEKLMRYWGW